MMFDNVAIMLPHIRSGALIPLAVTSSERFRLLPDVPTMAESGHPDFNVIGWFSLLAPADTPAQAYEALNEALNAAVKSESVERKMLELGAEPTTVTVEEANAYLDEEFERWGEVIKEMDLQLG